MTLRTTLGFGMFVVATILLGMAANIAPNDYFGIYVDALLGNASFPALGFTLLLIAVAFFYSLGGYLITPKRLSGKQLVVIMTAWLGLYCCYMAVIIWAGRPIYFGAWGLRDWSYFPFLIITSITFGLFLRVFSDPNSRNDVIGLMSGIVLWGIQVICSNWSGDGPPINGLMSKVLFVVFPLASLLLGSAILAIVINGFRNIVREFRSSHIITEKTI